MAPSWSDSFVAAFNEIRLSAVGRSRNVCRERMVETKLVLYFIGGGGGGGGGGGSGGEYPRLLICLYW